MKPVVHIVDCFNVAWSGSALEALATVDLLRDLAEVRVWSEGQPVAAYQSYTIGTLREDAGPRGGTLILVGAYYEPGPWLELCAAKRVIIKYNSITDLGLYRLIARIRAAGLPEPELVFASQYLAHRVALPGLVEHSAIDLAKFSPPRHKAAERPFTIGRHSRDVETKHHEDDPSLYRMLALQGHAIRIMGGTCLSPYMGKTIAGVQLLPAGAIPAPAFLHSLDCFFYRTFPTWQEAFGRVVVEAMSCGLPVVCVRHGGYVECIEHGIDGFLFDTQEEAYDLIQALGRDAPLRETIGQRARQKALALYGADSRARFRDWYLG